MSRLQKWQDIIKEKKRNNSFNDYLKEIVSLWPIVLYKTDWKISRFPSLDRIKWTVNNDDFFNEIENIEVREYDFQSNFFENYSSLNSRVHFPNLTHINSENCDYSDIVGWSKNAYLSFIVMESENVLYSYSVKDNSRNVVNSTVVSKWSENIFSSNTITQSFNIFYAKYITNSSNIWFCSNLIWCTECIFSDNLENKSYCISNKEFTKEEYFSQKKAILDNKEKFEEWFGNLSRIGKNIGSTNVNGNSIINSTNIVNWCFVNQVENGKNLIMVGSNSLFKNCYDVFDSGTGADSANLYWLSGWGMWNNQYNSIISLGSNLYYCNFCWECSFCIGCIWLKNKSYCILNKEYSKEEWYELVDKIFAQMDNDWILGNFFPSSINPFYFNDTMAYLINDKFTKEEIIASWFLWRDKKITVDIPEWAEVVKVEDLDIINFDEKILNKVIIDVQGNSYKIVRMEYEFLKKYNLPLPKKHWSERIKEGFRF